MNVSYSSHGCDQVSDKKWLKEGVVLSGSWPEEMQPIMAKESTVAHCSMDVEMWGNLLHHRGSGAQS